MKKALCVIVVVMCSACSQVNAIGNDLETVNPTEPFQKSYHLDFIEGIKEFFTYMFG